MTGDSQWKRMIPRLLLDERASRDVLFAALCNEDQNRCYPAWGIGDCPTFTATASANLTVDFGVTLS